MPFLLFEGRSAHYHTLIDQTVITNLCGLSNDHPHPVIDKESSADLCPGMDLDACKPAGEVIDQTGSGVPFLLIEEMCHPVEPDGMEPWVAEENLQIVLGRRVSLFDRSDIFFEALPHENISIFKNQPILTQTVDEIQCSNRSLGLILKRALKNHFML